MESFYLGHRAQLPGADNRIIHDIVVLLTNKFNNLISKFRWIVSILQTVYWQGKDPWIKLHFLISASNG